MNIASQNSYKELASVLDDWRKRRVNGVVLSIPGMGVSTMVKQYLAQHADTKRISGDNEDLENFNILDFDFDRDEGAVKIVDSYFQKAKADQKLIVLINSPNRWISDEAEKSYFKSHVYDTFKVKVLDKYDIRKLAEFLGWQVDEDELSKIDELSGGIGQIAKFIIVKKELDGEKLNGFEELNRILARINNEVINCKTVILEEMGLLKNNKVVSLLLKNFGESVSLPVSVKIAANLEVIEDEKGSGEKLARVERDILAKMISNNGFINKEDVSLIKWGSEEYSKFSDQALNKAMRRIDAKLKKHKIRTQWKTGYMLERR